MERISAADFDVWRQEKRSGAGRDPRISAKPRRPGSEPLLFREAALGFDMSAVPAPFFSEGPSVLAELIAAVLLAGLEIPAFY